MVKTRNARDAIDAVLAGREVPVKHTGVFGLLDKVARKVGAAGRGAPQDRAAADYRRYGDGGRLEEAPREFIKRMTLISFWATWCGSCIDEFADLEDTYLMYKVRDFDLVTVSANVPDEKDGVMRMLKKKMATSRIFSLPQSDTEALQKAFDPSWQSAVPVHDFARCEREGALQKHRHCRYSRAAPHDTRRHSIRLHRI